MTKSKKGKHNMDRAAAAAASFLIAAQADSTSDESTVQKRSTPRWTPDVRHVFCSCNFLCSLLGKFNPAMSFSHRV
jgi:hypothetical protein